MNNITVNKMKYWLVSDTHFNHTKLEEWGGRSGDWQQKIWDGISSIEEGDVLIHLGDICIGEDAEVHKKLATWKKVKGFKTILVRGNHDQKGVAWYYSNGWDFVCDSFELLFEGHYLKFTHRPMVPGQGNTTRNIHGHTHGNMHRSEEYLAYYDPTFHLDISPELVGYKPLRLDTLLKRKQI